MKTIKFRKKEYVIIERDEFEKAVYDANVALHDCESYAKHFKMVKDDIDAMTLRYWFMNEIIKHAIQGRERLTELFRKEV